MITLIGHGYVGTHIAKHLRNFEWISHQETPNKHTQCIINATGYIGYPNVEECEKSKQVCMEANVVYPLMLEQQSIAPVVHITSGCVYQGYPPGGYLETDPPNLNFDTGPFYSGCKALFQNLMTPFLDRSYVLRIRIPFDDTSQSKNLLYKVHHYPQLVDVQNSITSMEDLVRVVLMFVRDRPDFGLYNIVNQGVVSIKTIANLMNIVKPWVELESFDQQSTVVRSRCSLSTKKIQAIYPMPQVEEALEKTIYRYRKNHL